MIPYAVWTDSLDTTPVVARPKDVRKAFNQLVRPILIRIPEPYLENHPVTALRDTLLPKLISGQLRVKKGQRIVRGVV
jgi:type I restriction enzyme S subunit